MPTDSLSQYATDRNLRARQLLWRDQEPPFDLVAWTLDLAEFSKGDLVLDVGCGNGRYLAKMRERRIDAVGCDLSLGMLRTADHPLLIAGEVTALPFDDETFDVVLVPHMLYHVHDVSAAARELRRVVKQGGSCLAVTNGRGHVASIRALVEAAVREHLPNWEMLDEASVHFSLEDGAGQLRTAFDVVRCVRPANPSVVHIVDPQIVAGYVASVADRYQPQVPCRWEDIVAEVREHVGNLIARDGVFRTAGDVGALVCR